MSTKNLEHILIPTIRTKRPYTKRKGWVVNELLKQPLEERGKLSQEAWQSLEVELRRELREALRADEKTKPSPRELKDLATAAGIAQTKAYPGQELAGLHLHAPAHLLRAVSERILRSIPQPVDVTPEPLVEVVVESDVNQEKSMTS